MAKCCPITGEDVLYIHCIDCSRICEKIKSPSMISVISDDDIKEIKESSRKIGLNIHNWRDDSIQKTWKMFSSDNGYDFAIEVSNVSILRYFRWLRDKSGH